MVIVPSLDVSIVRINSTPSERGGGRASMWDIYHLGNHDGITMNDVGPRVAVGRGLAVGRALRPTTPLIRDVQSPQSVAHADNGVIT